jgi:DNA anti-recombination protein RmuC
MHRISDKRFTGISGREFKMFCKPCGDASLKKVVLVTNMWGEVSQEVGEACERELTTNFFKPALDKGARLARHHYTLQSALDIIRLIMKNHPIPPRARQGPTGRATNQESKDKDEETRKELEEETRKIKEWMDKMRSDSADMASRYQEERKHMEESIRQMQEQARQDREKTEAAYRKQIDDLNERLQESANASASKKGTITPPRAQREPTSGATNQEFEWFRRYQAELSAMREEIVQALKDRDEETRKVREELDRSRAELDRLRVESERLASAHNEERRRMEAEMWRREEEARAERGRLIGCLRRCPRCDQ